MHQLAVLVIRRPKFGILFQIDEEIAVSVSFFSSLQVPGLAESRPSVLRGDKLFAIILNPGDDKKYEAYVHHTELETVKLGLSSK